MAISLISYAKADIQHKIYVLCNIATGYGISVPKEIIKMQTCIQIGRPAADTINISPCYNTFMSTHHNAYLRILHFLMAQHRCLIF